MDSSLPGIACVLFIAVVFVIPMYAYILVTERKAKVARTKAIEAGRHEPVTIQPYIDPAVCMGSAACVTACPEHVLSVIDGQAIAVNMASCIGHGACVTACPVGAIELVFGSEKRGIDIPRVGPDFQTNVPGLYIAGELGGMGLIANASEQGARALGNAIEGLKRDPKLIDVAIVGAGPAGIAAAAAAKHRKVSYVLLEQEEMGGAIRHYPRKKLVFTRPMEFEGYKRVNLKTLHKEALVDLLLDVIDKVGIEVSTHERVDKISPRPGGGFTLKTTKREVHAQRVLLTLGRRGTPRKLGAKGEDVEKVAYSLLEPEHYTHDHLLVVGGGDSAVEAAIQLAEQAGNKVTLSYRGDKINRPKEKNIERLKDAQKAGQVEVVLESEVKEIRKDRVLIERGGEEMVLANDFVFVMVGGVLPTRFLQDAGVQIEKHFGKRIEAGDEMPAAPKPASPPKKQEKQAISPPSLPPTLPPFRLKGNDEPTLWLGPAPEPVDEVPMGTPFDPALARETTALRAAPPRTAAARQVELEEKKALPEKRPAANPTRQRPSRPPEPAEAKTTEMMLTRTPSKSVPPISAPPRSVPPSSAPPKSASQPGAAQPGAAQPSAASKDEAVPPELAALLRAAEHRLAAGSGEEVVVLTDRVQERVKHLFGDRPGPGPTGVLRWAALLAGEAHLERTDPEPAIASFTTAVRMGGGPPGALERARWGLARALTLAGQYAKASETLNDLLPELEHGDPRLGEALRLAGGLGLELGDLELAEVRFGQALDEARARETGADWALAQRGLATCTAVGGQPRMALRQLGEALGMLGADSDPGVVAPILADAIVLEAALGRYGSALSHATSLLDWTADLTEDRALALVLLGQMKATVGAFSAALGDAVRAVELLDDLGPAATDTRLRLARLLCELDRRKGALAVLDAIRTPPESILYDHAGQELSLRARAIATKDRASARTLAGDALGRPGPLHPLSQCMLRLDAARALLDAGDPAAARVAVKRGLKAVPGADPKGARLELLVTLHETNTDDTQVYDAMARTAARVMAELPKDAATTFRARGIIAPALRTAGSVEPDPVTRTLMVPTVRK